MKTIIKMAVCLALIFALTAENNPVIAQVNVDGNTFHKAAIGIRYMPTVSSMKVTNVQGSLVAFDFMLGYGIGGMFEINYSENIGFQAEVIYNHLSQKYRDAELERRINIDYVNIPLLLSLNTSRSERINLNAVIGPQAGVNVGSKLTTEPSYGMDSVHAVLAVKTGDFGIAYGAGIEIANRKRTLRLDLGFRGMFGLVNISDQSDPINNGSYYVLRRTNIKTYAAYVGLALLF